MRKTLSMSILLPLSLLVVSSLEAKEIPPGTTLVVRMIDSVDSSKHQPGQTFRASLDEPVIINGETLIPRNAEVLTKLVKVRKSGKVMGRSELTLDVVNVSFDGRTIDLNTTDSTTHGKSRSRESATVVGGGAALGAVIGALAGGGKGAAIGAITGAGAGTAVQVITRGSQVQVPSETRLKFELQHPVRL